MIGDVQEPLHMTVIALVMRLLHTTARHDPFEHSAFVDQEDVAEGLDVSDAIRDNVDTVRIKDRLSVINIATVIPERLRCAGV